MISFPAIMAAGATFIGAAQIELSREEAASLDIELSAINTQAEFLHPYPVILFGLDLNAFDACKLDGVAVQFFNEAGELVFSSSIAGIANSYTFQLLEDYLHSASLLIGCNTGPDRLGYQYLLKLIGYTQIP